MTKRWILPALAIPSLLALVPLALPASPPAPRAASPPLTVRTAAVQEVHSVSTPRVFSGEIHARRTTAIGFELPGEVVRVHVDEGERVEAGTLLAELDLRKLEARREELRARLAEAQARLEELEAGPRAQTIAAAEERVSELEERLELAERRRDRRAVLVEKNAVPAEALDDAQTEAEALAFQLGAARHVLDQLREGTRPEQIAAQRAAVGQLEAANRSVEVDLDNGRLLAPFAARIARRSVDEGTVVRAGEAVFRLIEQAPPEARVGVPIGLASDLRPDSTVALETRGVRYAGTVRTVLPEVDGATRTATVIVDVDAETAPALLPGEVVRLRIDSTEEIRGFWVPTTALTRGSRGLWVGYAVEPGAEGERVERRDLEVLYTEGERSLVRGVLREGDRLIVDGLHRVVPGQVVTSTPRDAGLE